MTLRRTAADSVARSLGISLGMPATKAQALVAKLIIQNADAEGDGASLYALIEECCTARNQTRGAELAHGSRRMRHRSPGKLTIMCDADRPNGRIER